MSASRRFKRDTSNLGQAIGEGIKEGMAMSNKIMDEAATPGPVPERGGMSIGQQKRERFLAERDGLIAHPIARRKVASEEDTVAAIERSMLAEAQGAVEGLAMYARIPRERNMAEINPLPEGVEQATLAVEKLITGDYLLVGEPEVRSVSSTGAEKGVKKSRFSLIPPGPLKELAEHYGVGAEKYDEHNWAKGYEWSKSIDSLTRHLNAFQSGEDRDPETGSKHMTAVAWHAFTLMAFMETHPEFDDRLSTLMKEARDGK